MQILRKYPALWQNKSSVRQTIDIVVWPTMSCFTDWSKRRHVTLSIIIRSSYFTLIASVCWSGHLTFTKCKRKIYSTLFLFKFCVCFLLFFCHTTKHMTHSRSWDMEKSARVWHFQPRVVIFPCLTHYRASSVKCSTFWGFAPRPHQGSTPVRLAVLQTFPHFNTPSAAYGCVKLLPRAPHLFWQVYAYGSATISFYFSSMAKLRVCQLLY